MRNAKLTAALAATALALTAPSALAQRARAALNIESPFKGIVVSVSSAGLVAKGEFNPSGAADLSSAKPSRSIARTAHFVIKGAKITRGGWRSCELDDIQKGAKVTITFDPPAQARARLAATQVDLAAESADQAPIMGKVGKILYEDDFARADMKPKWRVGKGFWSIEDGVVKSAENPADNHSAYAYAEPRFTYKNIVAEFSLKFDGSTGCHLMMEDSNYKAAHAGHIIRTSVTPTSVNLADSKFGSMKNEIFEKMKDPKTTEEEKKQIQASIKDKSASFKIELDTDKWHQVRVEVVGDEMLASIDNQPVGYFKSEGVDHPTKNMIGFSVAGKSAHLDNLRVWEATPRDDWSKSRSDIQSVLPKR